MPDLNAKGTLPAELREHSLVIGEVTLSGAATAAIPPARAALAVPGGKDLVGFFVRGKRKQHGMQRWLEALERIREQGLEIVGTLVVDRLAGGVEAIAAAAGVPCRALVTIDEIYPDRPDRG